MRQRRQSETSAVVRGFFPNRITPDRVANTDAPIHDSLLVALAALDQLGTEITATKAGLASALSGQLSFPDCPGAADALKKAVADHAAAANEKTVWPLDLFEGRREQFLKLWPQVTSR
jgi:hypothetical protein